MGGSCRMMTASYGFGMLAVGLVAITIGATVAFWIINKLEENKKQEKERKEWEDRYGR